MRYLTAAVTSFLVLGLLTGCANPLSSPTQPPSSPSTLPSPSPSVTGSTEFVPPTVATFEPAGTSSAEWDVVALGDSNVAGWGVRAGERFSPDAAFPGLYAAALADQQGVSMTLHSYYPDQLGNEIRTIAEWTDVVGRDPSMQADLAEAKIVVLLIGFHDMLAVFLHDACPPPWPEPMKACLNTRTAPMRADFVELYAAIGALVPSDAIVLVLDYGSTPTAFEYWGNDPAWQEIRQAMFGDWQDALRDEATAAGFVVVHMSTALMHDDGAPRYDVNEVTSDGLHFNTEGHRILAEQCLLEDGLPG